MLRQGRVDGDRPQQASVTAHHRQRGELLIGYLACGLPRRLERLNAADVGVHQRTDQRVVVGNREVAQADHAFEMAIRLGVDDVQVVGEIGRRDSWLQLTSRLAYRVGSQHTHELVGHDAAGRIVRIAQQVDDQLASRRQHLAQESLGTLGSQVAKQVRGCLGRHRGQQPHRLVFVQHLDDLRLALGRHRLERVGGDRIRP